LLILGFPHVGMIQSLLVVLLDDLQGRASAGGFKGGESSVDGTW